jgi:hypothetical protein
MRDMLLCKMGVGPIWPVAMLVKSTGGRHAALVLSYNRWSLTIYGAA